MLPGLFVGIGTIQQEGSPWDSLIENVILIQELLLVTGHEVGFVY